MSISARDLAAFRKELLAAERPLIFFDDDPDGVASYAVVVRSLQRAAAREDRQFRWTGVIVKKTSEVGTRYVRRVEESHPDLILVLDKARLDPQFVERALKAAPEARLLWLDHHPPQEISHDRLTYLNPRHKTPDDPRPTTYWAYELFKELPRAEEDLWLAALGTVGDWHEPEFLPEVRKRYPGLVPPAKEIKDNGFGQLYLDSKLGRLIKLTTFNLKGSVSETLASVRVLLKIKDPAEILEQSTSQGRYLWKKYLAHAQRYDELVKRGCAIGEKAVKEKLPYLIFVYEGDHTYTSELSNELLLRFQKQIMIIARRYKGEVKGSLRSSDEGPVLNVSLKKALEGLKGFGGGHPHACGVCLREEEWPKFVERFLGELRTSAP